MKGFSRTIGTIALTTLVWGITLTVEAQTVILRGRQIRGSVMHPADLISREVTLNRSYRVTDVTTSGDGFWLERDGIPGEVIAPPSSARNTVIPPGTYRVFPTLRNGQSEAGVTVTLD
ncbi:MAG: hypothetical protein ACK456_12155 [Pseudanabaenaceae cyanobacterium]|jgi:hypothetical protein